VNELLEQARVLPGCNQDERRAMYWEAMDIIRDEMPWLPFGSSLVTYVAQTNVENWAPTIGVERWNIDSWFVFEPGS
jgi:ABC-type transport system substrate-binding protein